MKLEFKKKERMGLETIFPTPFTCGIGIEMILIYFEKSN
jgi:hypothetical protein